MHSHLFSERGLSCSWWALDQHYVLNTDGCRDGVRAGEIVDPEQHDRPRC